MFYYKAEATFTINGAEAILNACKSSNRNYSHAVVVIASDLTDESSLTYGKTSSIISFHQGLDNAVKASKSYVNLGGKRSVGKNGFYKYEINPTAEIKIVETTLVDSKTYRNFKPNYIDSNGQVVKGGE